MKTRVLNIKKIISKKRKRKGKKGKQKNCEKKKEKKNRHARDGLPAGARADNVAGARARISRRVEISTKYETRILKTCAFFYLLVMESVTFRSC